MDMRKLVGRNSARLRRERDPKQEDVADRSGFSQQYLSSLERGRRNPTVIKLCRLRSLHTRFAIAHFGVCLSNHMEQRQRRLLLTSKHDLGHYAIAISGMPDTCAMR